MPQPDALVIGAGPAGLMAAEELAKAGVQTLVVEAKPTVARKFLMAGKSGLNVTKDEDLGDLRLPLRHPPPPPDPAGLRPERGPDWCRALGQDVYTGSSGRVFPVAMKASPLLRAWLQRLTSQGVEIRTRWRWTGFDGTALTFDTPTGPQTLTPKVTILALGGASWQRLGSDGAWVPWLREKGVEITDWQPANMGFRVDWSPHMAPFFGQPGQRRRPEGLLQDARPTNAGNSSYPPKAWRVAVSTVYTSIYATHIRSPSTSSPT